MMGIYAVLLISAIGGGDALVNLPVPRENAYSSSSVRSLNHRAPTRVPGLLVRGGALSSMGAEALVTRVVPVLGTVLSNGMFLAGLPAVLEARKQKSLGSLNPLPLAFIFINCCAWLHYGFVVKNVWPFYCNVLGSALGLFFTLTMVRLGTPDQSAKVEKVITFFTAVNLVSTYLTAFVATSADQRQLIAGVTANVILVIYYSAPLSSLKEIIASKSAESIFAPLVALNGVNGALWLAYGLHIGDLFMAVPNALGLFFAIVQLCIKAYYTESKTATA